MKELGTRLIVMLIITSFAVLVVMTAGRFREDLSGVDLRGHFTQIGPRFAEWKADRAERAARRAERDARWKEYETRRKADTERRVRHYEQRMWSTLNDAFRYARQGYSESAEQSYDRAFDAITERIRLTDDRNGTMNLFDQYRDVARDQQAEYGANVYHTVLRWETRMRTTLNARLRNKMREEGGR